MTVLRGVAPVPTESVTVALLGVLVVGKKLTLIVQLALTVAGNVIPPFVPHVFDTRKLPGLVPPFVMPLTMSGVVPVLVIVTVWAALVVLMF